MVQIHDDTPRCKWKLGVIEGLKCWFLPVCDCTYSKWACQSSNRNIQKWYIHEPTATQSDDRTSHKHVILIMPST